jgi:hypothetical protein
MLNTVYFSFYEIRAFTVTFTKSFLVLELFLVLEPTGNRMWNLPTELVGSILLL